MESAEHWDRVLASVVCVHGDAEHCSPCCIAVIRQAQADAIEWARQLYQNWSTKDHGNLIESYNRLLSKKRDSILKGGNGEEVTEEPGPKFKEGDPIKVRGNVESTWRNCHGNVKVVIPPSTPQTGLRCEYNIQLHSSTAGFLTRWSEDELEAVEEGKGE